MEGGGETSEDDGAGCEREDAGVCEVVLATCVLFWEYLRSLDDGTRVAKGLRFRTGARNPIGLGWNSLRDGFVLRDALFPTSPVIRLFDSYFRVRD